MRVHSFLGSRGYSFYQIPKKTYSSQRVMNHYCNSNASCLQYASILGAPEDLSPQWWQSMSPFRGIPPVKVPVCHSRSLSGHRLLGNKVCGGWTGTWWQRMRRHEDLCEPLNYLVCSALCEVCLKMLRENIKNSCVCILYFFIWVTHILWGVGRFLFGN